MLPQRPSSVTSWHWGTMIAWTGTINVDSRRMKSTVLPRNGSFATTQPASRLTAVVMPADRCCRRGGEGRHRCSCLRRSSAGRVAGAAEAPRQAGDGQRDEEDDDAHRCRVAELTGAVLVEAGLVRVGDEHRGREVRPA